MTRQLKLDLSILHDLQLVSHLDYYFAKNMGQVFHETSSMVGKEVAEIGSEKDTDPEGLRERQPEGLREGAPFIRS